MAERVLHPDQAKLMVEMRTALEWLGVFGADAIPQPFRGAIAFAVAFTAAQAECGDEGLRLFLDVCKEEARKDEADKANRGG